MEKTRHFSSDLKCLQLARFKLVVSQRLWPELRVSRLQRHGPFAQPGLTIFPTHEILSRQLTYLKSLLHCSALSQHLAWFSHVSQQPLLPPFAVQRLTDYCGPNPWQTFSTPLYTCGLFRAHNDQRCHSGPCSKWGGQAQLNWSKQLVLQVL